MELHLGGAWVAAIIWPRAAELLHYEAVPTPGHRHTTQWRTSSPQFYGGGGGGGLTLINVEKRTAEKHMHGHGHGSDGMMHESCTTSQQLNRQHARSLSLLVKGDFGVLPFVCYREPSSHRLLFIDHYWILSYRLWQCMAAEK